MAPLPDLTKTLGLGLEGSRTQDAVRAPTRKETAAENHQNLFEIQRLCQNCSALSLYRLLTEQSATLTPHQLAREAPAGRFSSSVRGARRPWAPGDGVEVAAPITPRSTLPTPPRPRTPLPNGQNSEWAPNSEQPFPVVRGEARPNLTEAQGMLCSRWASRGP